MQNYTRLWSLTGCLAILINLSTQAEPPLEAPFTRITEGEIATEKYTSEGAAWGDYNNDGWLDLLVGHDIDPPSLFRNNKDGTFTRITSGPLGSTNQVGFHAAAWADYDNDGFLDLTFASFLGGRSPFFHNDGQGNFIQLDPAVSGEIPTPFGTLGDVAVAWGDYDSDGLLDLFVGRGAFDFAPGDFLYHNDGGKFSNVVNVVTEARYNTSQGTWADYDNDGDIDLFVTHYLEQGNTLYQNDGRGNFTNVTQTAGLTDLARSVGSAWGDFDNDGDLDLVISNYRNTAGPATRNFLYLNNGDGTFSRITNGPIANELGWFITCAWVDYDNDGWLDLFVTGDGREFKRGRNYLYKNLGGGNFAAVTNGVLVTDGANPAGCSWGDYNNDGFPDVFVANGGLWAGQVNGLYRNNTNGNSWIKLKCVGTRSNRSAIGTKVRVKATIGGVERWQMRHIAGTEGWLSFNALDVLVGLGDATKIDVIRIEWPSGLVEEMQDVPVKQTLTVVEGSITAGPQLKIERADKGRAILTWPSADYLLEETTSLENPSWEPVAGVAGTAHELPAEGRRFFRLKHR